MSNKKPKYTPKPFESKGAKFKDGNGTNRADTSANIFESMLLSDAFIRLKTRQKMLYVIAKAQYYGKRKPKQDFNDTGLFQSNEYFYLNFNNVLDYGLYTKTMKKEFYGDIKALCEFGFIELASKGGRDGQTKSIYKYSDKWRTYTPIGQK